VHNLNTLYEAEKGKAKAAGFKATPDDLKREHAYNMAEKIDSELMMVTLLFLLLACLSALVWLFFFLIF